jgi:hypothetical protein
LAAAFRSVFEPDKGLIIAERERGESNSPIAVLNGQERFGPRHTLQFGQPILKVFQAANTLVRGFDDQIPRFQLPIRNVLRLRP